MTHRCAFHLYYLRGDSWYVQRKVPKHLEQIIGKNIIARSLGTTDRKTAEFRSENEGRVQELTDAAKKWFSRSSPSESRELGAPGADPDHHEENP